MKSITTLKKHLSFFALLLFANFSFSQTLTNIDASGVTFTPSNISINVGDTVRWTNSSGTHNVNGTTATFPSNPDSFGNNIGSGWVYTYIFTIAGSYDYRCDVHFGSGMTGTITVLPLAGVEDLSIINESLIYPIPASNSITVELNQVNLENLQLKIVDAKGAVVYENDKISEKVITINTKEWNGTYFYQLYRDNQAIENKKLTIN
tara:strand:+ start:50139 stop:50756 length:618 start_codon:yes stop_codon:yes gene_type:complete